MELLDSRKVGPKETCYFEVETTPWRTGNTTVIVIFNSNELYDISGLVKVNVIA